MSKKQAQRKSAKKSAVEETASQLRKSYELVKIRRKDADKKKELSDRADEALVEAASSYEFAKGKHREALKDMSYIR